MRQLQFYAGEGSELRYPICVSVTSACVALGLENDCVALGLEND